MASDVKNEDVLRGIVLDEVDDTVTDTSNAIVESVPTAAFLNARFKNYQIISSNEVVISK